MRFNETSVAGTFTILASHDYQAVPVCVTAQPASGSIVKAGTPLTEAGAEATASDVFGLLLHDVDVEDNPNGALLVDGIIDAKKTEAHSGVTYSDEMKAALPKITFRTNIGVND